MWGEVLKSSFGSGQAKKRGPVFIGGVGSSGHPEGGYHYMIQPF